MAEMAILRRANDAVMSAAQDAEKARAPGGGGLRSSSTLCTALLAPVTRSATADHSHPALRCPAPPLCPAHSFTCAWPLLQARQLLGAGLPQVDPEIMKAAR